MLDPIALTVASMQNDMQRMNVLSNNAANALTPGFKRELVAAASLGVTESINNDPLSGLPIQTSLIDRSPGTPRRTSTPLDIALVGDGYLEIKTDQGLAYTRLGALHLDERGRLVTQAGYPVMGTSGELILASSSPVIDRTGQIFDNGKPVGQIKVVDFEHPERMRSIGGGLMVTENNSPVQDAQRVRVVQGHLESSNVDSAREMISLVETFRHFESSNRVLQAYDDIRDKAFRNLGQF